VALGAPANFLLFLELEELPGDGGAGGAASIGKILMGQTNAEPGSLGDGMADFLFQQLQELVQTLRYFSHPRDRQQRFCLLQSPVDLG